MKHSIGYENRSMVLTFHENLTFEAHTILQDVIVRLDGEDFSAITVDMSGVAYVDSAGLGMMLLLSETASKKNVRPVLRNIAPSVGRLLKVARFDTYFDIP